MGGPLSEGGKQVPGRRAGRWMIYAAWILVLLMATWVFRVILNDQHNPNQNVTTRTDGGAVEVRLERNNQGHFVASGRINGHPVTFLIDTGATDVSIPGTLADRIGLERKARVNYSTANGVAAAYLTRLDSVRIGDIEIRDIRGSINPNVEFDEVLLGMSFLEQIDFTQRNQQLILRQGVSR